MADSKIDFSFENLHFSCEGENVWVEKQLNNVLSHIPALLSVHKKGENFVEEVIDVKEEDVKEVHKKPANVTEIISKTPKKKKTKATKVVKETVAEDNITKEKIVKEPKIKTVKETTVKKETEPAKRGRKSKIVEKPAPNVKEAKVKLTKPKPVVEHTDSPLYQFIAEKKSTKNQVRKFLTTAVFLANNNNVSKLSTPMISRALKSYGIDKLQNASDCLNKNEKKGYCIKEGKEFIITENGYLSIG